MRYQPPAQSRAGQFVDVLVLLILTLGALYAPLWLGLAGASKEVVPVENPTWESLGQNPVMVERWNALGYADPTSSLNPEAEDPLMAWEIITARFDYSFGALSLILMIVVVAGYFAMLLRLSEREYRQVISEKFDEPTGERR